MDKTALEIKFVIDQTVIEILFVGYEDYRAGKFGYCFEQCVFSRLIQMVGRLVQNQEIGGLLTHCGEPGFDDFAPGKIGEFPQSQFLPHPHISQSCPYLGVAHLGVKAKQKRERGLLVVYSFVLVEIVDFGPRQELIIPAQRRQKTQYGFDKCGLSYAILAQNGYFLASLQNEGNGV